MLEWSQSLYLWINGFAGHWPILDEIQSLVLTNDLLDRIGDEMVAG